MKERSVLSYPELGQHPIFSGADKFKLPQLVSQDCKRILNMGVCGGLAPPLKVADVAMATNIVDKAGLVIDLDCVWADNIFKAGYMTRVPWYSSGLLDEADTKGQRAYIHNRYATRPQCIDDESRFTVAFAKQRDIPCVIVRPLSDDWSETLPLEARATVMNSDGTLSVSRFFHTFQLIDIPQLVHIAADYDRSLDALENVARAIREAVLA